MRRARKTAETDRRREIEEAFRNIEAQGDSWHRSQRIREYLDAAASRIGPLTMSAENRGILEEWIRLGRYFADRLDPLQEGTFGPLKLPLPRLEE